MGIALKLPQDAWGQDNDIELDFPFGWNVVVCNMKGYNKPKIENDDIVKAFTNPISTPPLRHLAKGRKRIVILFDDMARGTKVSKIIPFLLEELRIANIPDNSIRFISALGAHGAMTRIDFVKKLGSEVVDRFPVYNHNPYENCTLIGTTKAGTPISVNAEVLSCDLKIGIGGIVPHPEAGFGGGSKIVLPGIASMETIWSNHTLAGITRFTEQHPLGQYEQGVGIAMVEGNVMRLDMEEAARMVGLDMIINVVMNLKRDIIGIFVGDVVRAFNEGVSFAREIYQTEKVTGADIVIAGAYSKGNEAFLNLAFGELLREEGGYIVIVEDVSQGQVVHYLCGPFGEFCCGRLAQLHDVLPPKVKKVFILSSYPDRAASSWFGPSESVVWLKSWSELVNRLRSICPKAKVVVIPDGTVQYLKE